MEGVLVSSITRFPHLYGRSVDLLLLGDTHTIEREVRERKTGAGFTFSSPYYYDGLTYFGNETFVDCAENLERHGVCSSLQVCVINSTTNHEVMEASFPSDFFLVGFSSLELANMLRNNTCNVVAEDRSSLLADASNFNISDGYFFGKKTMSKDPTSVVTRNDDREFSDIVNWVVHALFYGEEQGLTKDPPLCQNYTTLTSKVSELNFLNAVHCVGNYLEVWGDRENYHRGMNRINNATTGMVYATPFGNLENEGGVIGDLYASDGDPLLHSIRDGGSLNCGVIVPHNFTGTLKKSDKLVGMSVTFCRTVMAALFNGNADNGSKLLQFTENDDSAYAALDNGTINVLAGARIDRNYDFAGFHFSTPYYYGNETASNDVSFFSLATREDDVVFSSFVNCVVLATMYAQDKGIRDKKFLEMPLSSIFGSDFSWALRDAIAYSGGYDQIYTEHFGQSEEDDRGRNILNEDGSPQMHSFPGLNH